VLLPPVLLLLLLLLLQAMLAKLLAATPASLTGPRQAKLHADLQQQCMEVLQGHIDAVLQRREAHYRARLAAAARDALAGFKETLNCLNEGGSDDESSGTDDDYNEGGYCINEGAAVAACEVRAAGRASQDVLCTSGICKVVDSVVMSWQ
jgi:hypothetical protein